LANIKMMAPQSLYPKAVSKSVVMVFFRK
jgi:hypothetical protein